MIDTVDLTSYIPGYEEYCEQLENDAKVDSSEYEYIKDINDNYYDLIEDIESILDERTTDKKKIQIIRSLIEDFKGV